MSSIYIQIPSYHDLELINTISSFASMCSSQNRIHFGIHNCFYDKNPWSVETIKNAIKNTNHKISIYESKFPDNIGVGKSRNIANSFYSGEEYYLQTDSHMRACLNWDKLLIKEFKNWTEKGIKKPIISQYAKRYFPNSTAVSHALDLYPDLLFNEKNNYYYENYFYNLIDSNELSYINIEKTDFDHLFNKVLNLSIPLEVMQKGLEKIFYSGHYAFSFGDFSQIQYNDNIILKYEEGFHSLMKFNKYFEVVPPSGLYLWHLYRYEIGECDNSENNLLHFKRRHIDKDIVFYYGNDHYNNIYKISKQIFINAVLENQYTKQFIYKPI